MTPSHKFTPMTNSDPVDSKCAKIYRLISELDDCLAEVVEGGDKFILTVVATRAALKALRKFF